MPARSSPDDATAITQVSGVAIRGRRVERARPDHGGQPELEHARSRAPMSDFPLIRSWQVDTGSFFTSQDVTAAAKVAVLGNTVRDQLFGPGFDPTGEIIRRSGTSPSRSSA